jgi:hypothetical protein
VTIVCQLAEVIYSENVNLKKAPDEPDLKITKLEVSTVLHPVDPWAGVHHRQNQAKAGHFLAQSCGAGRGGRTPMTRRSTDFESVASASSAIPAKDENSILHDCSNHQCGGTDCLKGASLLRSGSGYLSNLLQPDGFG